MGIFDRKRKKNRNSHKIILVLTSCLTLLCLSACSSNADETHSTVEAVSSIESTADFSVEKDIRVVELEDNDSGVSNPQKKFQRTVFRK